MVVVQEGQEIRRFGGRLSLMAAARPARSLSFCLLTFDHPIADVANLCLRLRRLTSALVDRWVAAKISELFIPFAPNCAATEVK